jgi:hypothetical protein
MSGFYFRRRASEMKKSSFSFPNRGEKKEAECLLLLAFFEDDVLSGFGIVLFELDLAGDQLLVLAGPVHLSGAFVFKLYELVLRHIR